ncbi:MAG: hypothetical protein U1C46_02035 [Bacteroidales bacterium]|nr:hypothetical protein [Bacteroidales bacterium]MDZ4203574.1 hypothetical protein [Bacteroidales bacterium]
MSFLKIMIFAVVLLGLAWAAISIKMFVHKNGQFTKTCGSVDPKSGKPVRCTCHNDTTQDCDNL